MELPRGCARFDAVDSRERRGDRPFKAVARVRIPLGHPVGADTPSELGRRRNQTVRVRFRRGPRDLTLRVRASRDEPPTASTQADDVASARRPTPVRQPRSRPPHPTRHDPTLVQRGPLGLRGRPQQTPPSRPRRGRPTHIERGSPDGDVHDGQRGPTARSRRLRHVGGWHRPHSWEPPTGDLLLRQLIQTYDRYRRRQRFLTGH